MRLLREKSMAVKMAILIQHYKTAPDEHLRANNIAYVMKSEQKKQQRKHNISL